MSASLVSSPVRRVVLLALASALAVTTACSGKGDDPLGPGPAPAVTLTAGTAVQVSGLVGAAVTPVPTVKATDANGRPVAGLPVTFTVTGGGTIGRTSATTDASGIASVGSWTLGIEPGAQTLRASAGSLTTTFSAAATLPTGCAIAPYAVGARIQGRWAAGDCASPSGRGASDPAGALYDQYELTLATQQTLLFKLAAAGSRTVRIRRKAGANDYVALALGGAFTTTSGDTIVNRVVLAPDTYIVEVQSGAAGATGDYTLHSSAQGDTDVVCRPIVQATLGVTITGAIEPAKDCESPVAPGTYEDWIVLPLKTGDRLRLTLTTTTMPPGLVLRDDRLGPASPTLKVASSTTPGTVTIDWTATFDTYHEIVVFKNGGAGAPYGPYTLKVERMP